MIEKTKIYDYIINESDLKYLLENKILEEGRDGNYVIKSVNGLYNHAKRLTINHKYQKAKYCFIKCFEINPNNPEVCFQLFFKSVYDDDYESAIKYFEYLYESDNEFHKDNNNYFLYLLNIICDVPEKHRAYAKYISDDDIKINEESPLYPDLLKENEIRHLSIEQKFSLAIKKLDELLEERGRLDNQHLIIKMLLNKAFQIQKENRLICTTLVSEKKYEELVDFLENIKMRSKLAIYDEYVLDLAKDLLEIKKSDIVPLKSDVNANNVFDAVRAKNYELALSLFKDTLKAVNNSIYQLLLEIVSLIEQNKSEQIKAQNSTTGTEFNGFQDFLNNADNSLSNLKRHLLVIGKKQYDFLVMALIKISILEEDYTFSKPMEVITKLENDTYHFQVSEYVMAFYNNLAQNNFDIAKQYLYILDNSSILGTPFVLKNEMRQILINSENEANYRETEDPLAKLIRNIQSNNSVNEVEESTLPDEDTLVDDTNERHFVDEKLPTLYEKGISVIGSLDFETFKKIFDIASQIPDVFAFKVGSGYSKKLILRYKPSEEESFRLTNASFCLNKAFDNGEYKECLDLYFDIIKYRDIKAKIYANMGLSWLKDSDTKTAGDYFFVAGEIIKNFGGNSDFIKLSDKLNSPDFDPNSIEIPEVNHDAKVADSYDTELFDQVVNYVSLGYTLDLACKRVGVSDEYKSIILLIFAKEYYTYKETNRGDECLAMLEKIKGKPKFIKDLIEQVKKNRKFYKNRIDDEERSLGLTLHLK